MIIYINLKYDHYYKTNITSIENLLLLPNIKYVEYIGSNQINDDMYNMIQILYQNIFQKMINDDEDVLNQYKYDIIGYLTKHNINSDKFLSTKKQTFTNYISNKIDNDKLKYKLDQLYDKIVKCLNEIKESELCNKKRKRYFKEQVIIEFGKQFENKINQLSTGILDYLLEHQVILYVLYILYQYIRCLCFLFIILV